MDTDMLGKSITHSDVDALAAGMNKQQKGLTFDNHIDLGDKNHLTIFGPFDKG
jgi:hypothetical protein